jgi:hypothetical protein
MSKHMVLGIILLTLATSSRHAEAVTALTRDFVPGQEWSVKSVFPTNAKVVIARVDKWKGEEAVHVSIVDIRIPGLGGGASTVITIGHVAFEKAALDASVDRLIATGVSPAPSFKAGYKQWKDEQGGLSTTSVANVIAYGLIAMSQARHR